MSAAENYLLNHLIDDPDPTWLGEILIVKSDASGFPVDVCEDDLDIIPIILRK